MDSLWFAFFCHDSEHLAKTTAACTIFDIASTVNVMPKIIGEERKERKKEIPYKEGILKDIGAHEGYTVLYWRGGYLSGGTKLDTPRERYTRAITNSTARGL